MRFVNPSFLVLASAALLACARMSAGADFAPGLDLQPYRTFDWGAGDTLTAGDPRLDDNPFFDARVRAAVELELAAKGVQRDTTVPDLLIHYHASVRQRVDVVRADEMRGYTFGRVNAPDKVLAYEEGTLILDVAEAKTKRILWRGWSQTDVDGLLNDPPALEKRIGESVRKMMAQFPRLP